MLPFILRGVRLLGVNANPLMPLRQKLWDQIANDYRPTHLNDIARVISIDELPTYLDLTLAGQIRGRTVVDMSG